MKNNCFFKTKSEKSGIVLHVLQMSLMLGIIENNFTFPYVYIFYLLKYVTLVEAYEKNIWSHLDI